MLRTTAASIARQTAIATLSAAIVRRGEAADVQAVSNWIADTARPAWQRSALRLGTEGRPPTSALMPVARRGPGAPTARTATAAAPGPPPPCPTCPGARGGPGGARAFPSSQDTVTPARRAGGPAPHTPDDRDGLVAGQEVYDALCVACHQPERSGLGLATSLLAWFIANGPHGAAVRIVLQEIRVMSSDRTRPWTEEELLEIARSTGR
jgi:mono/diheme cytochrome c family protein